MTLIERGSELDFLEGMFAGARSGRGQVAHVVGGVGCGKSVLLQAFAENVVAAGGTVLAAAAARIEQALPLGVIGQLFSGVRTEYSVGVAPLLDEAIAGARLLEPGSAQADRAIVPIMRVVATTLLEIAAEAPLVISVDDVQHADVASLQCLSFLARRFGSASGLLVLAEGATAHTSYASLHSELLRHPNVRRISVRCLSPAGTATLLGHHLHEAPPGEVVAEYHSITAGNPLLLNALVEDNIHIGRMVGRRVVAGDAFDRAVADCLYRLDDDTRRYTHMLAALSDGARSVLTRLTDLRPEAAARARRNLAAAGVIDGYRLRHPGITAAVVRAMDPEDRATTCARAAHLLYHTGAPAHAIAPELIAGGERPPWGVAVLLEAGGHAAAIGETDIALNYLQHAHRMAEDDRQRVATLAAIAKVNWCIDPRISLRHSAALVAATKEGWLSGTSAIDPIFYLLWTGRTAEAIEVMDHLTRNRTYAGDAAAERALVVARLWCQYIFPKCRNEVDVQEDALSSAVVAEADSVLMLQALNRHEYSDRVATLAEQLLQHARLADAGVAPLMAALFTLVFVERLDLVEACCTALLDEAMASNAPTWIALLRAVRAEVHLRRGELVEADNDASVALAALPAESWGVAIGLPVGTMLRIAIASGDSERAADCLTTPMPGMMIESLPGLHFLYARASYYQATGQYEAALSDLETCRSIMTTAEIDMPAVVPWRSESARAYLGLGDAAQALKLAEEQLGMLDTDQSRVRGMTMRVIATASEVRRQPALLTEAVNLLKQAGDRLELAHAFADLSRSLHLLGEPHKAHSMRRTAQYIAQQCHAAESLHLPIGAKNPEPLDGGAGDELSDTLSSAERRVAVLAAQGHTNRQISAKLCITISTVEQHLTRIYRKLNVKRRGDLSPALHVGRAEPA